MARMRSLSCWIWPVGFLAFCGRGEGDDCCLCGFFFFFLVGGGGGGGCLLLGGGGGRKEMRCDGGL